MFQTDNDLGVLADVCIRRVVCTTSAEEPDAVLRSINPVKIYLRRACVSIFGGHVSTQTRKVAAPGESSDPSQALWA